MATCLESDCDRPVKVKSRSLCGLHAGRAQKTEHGPCSVEGCDLKWKSSGLCAKHYDRLRANGDPLVVQQIRLDDDARLASKVDRSGGPFACWPFLGRVDKDGYCAFSFHRRTSKAHIVAWILANSSVPEGYDIDHECHNTAKRAGLCPGGICEHRRCCNPRHLAAKPRREHFDDTVPWQRTSKANLTGDVVREIKILLRDGVSGRKIAAMYELTPNTISRINLGKVHASVTIEDEPAGPAA